MPRIADILLRRTGYAYLSRLDISMQHYTFEMDAASKENMKKVLTMIQDGTFNNEWISEYQKNGKDAFDKYMKEYDEHQIEKVGKEMRKMMWPDSTE